MAAKEKLTLDALKGAKEPEEDRWGETSTHKSYCCDDRQSAISVLANFTDVDKVYYIQRRVLRCTWRLHVHNKEMKLKPPLRCAKSFFLNHL